MPVFKTIPRGRPQVANAKKDHEWRRLAVEGTVREWFRYMNVTQQEAATIRKDWEAAFCVAASRWQLQPSTWLSADEMERSASPATKAC